MPDIINLLPDTVANQIAAGEVIQRPASVVKELIENAIDAQSTHITIHIKDAGKTLIQVIDNGIGMSETDARMSLERHATSKIKDAKDLFAINTMGFRGEALASISSVAQVELKTCPQNNELGTHIVVKGSKLEKQEPVSCSVGTNFLVKNLFFNVPARRKFLKANTTELRHITNEIYRVALTNSEIVFELYHNNTPILNLPAGNIKQRITQLFGNNIKNYLLDIRCDTNLIQLSGYICKPEHSKKTYGEQYFFANGRYIRHPYFHKAVVEAYNKLLPTDALPSYFIYLQTDPKNIDINIHPTKTEVKFQNERFIWQIINSSTRETLGKFNIVPTIDFNTEGAVPIPSASSVKETVAPQVDLDPTYNPFEKTGTEKLPHRSRQNIGNWEELYKDFNQPSSNTDVVAVEDDKHEQQHIPITKEKEEPITNLLQVKNKYILTPVKSGLMLVDQRKAHIRILYEQLCQNTKNKNVVQKTLYPTTLELNASDSLLFTTLLPEINSLGFEIKEFGKQAFIINGTPSVIGDTPPKPIIEQLLEDYKNKEKKLKLEIYEKIALSLAKSSAIESTQSLTQEEMGKLLGNLFACQTPNYTPDGKPTTYTMQTSEIDKFFK